MKARGKKTCLLDFKKFCKGKIWQKEGKCRFRWDDGDGRNFWSRALMLEKESVIEKEEDSHEWNSRK